jgi:hypothetical protein
MRSNDSLEIAGAAGVARISAARADLERALAARTERRRNRTFQPPGCDGLPVLKAPHRRVIQ